MKSPVILSNSLVLFWVISLVVFIRLSLVPGGAQQPSIELVESLRGLSVEEIASDERKWGPVIGFTARTTEDVKWQLRVMNACLKNQIAEYDRSNAILDELQNAENARSESIKNKIRTLMRRALEKKAQVAELTRQRDQLIKSELFTGENPK